LHGASLARQIEPIAPVRANYDSVFPPAESVNKLRENEPIVHSVNGTWIHQGGESLS